MNKIWANKSLRLRLMLALSSITLSIWLIATAIECVSFKKEMNRQFDTQLVFFAERLASSNLMQGFHEVQEPEKRYEKHVDDDALAFAVFTERGDLIMNDGRNGQFIAFTPKKGFHTSQILEADDDESEAWRIFWLKSNDVYIAVAQELDYRDDIIMEMMLSKLWGGVIALPLLLIAIGSILSKELSPLRRLEQQVLQRKPDDTNPIIVPSLPKEIQPLVASLNHYFERSHTMLNRERRFTSDAAHELRSPLAGVRIQTEIAQMTQDDAKAHERALNNLLGGIDQITQLMDQLLTLSRLESLTELDSLEEINWQTLIEQGVSQCYHQAELKGSDIQFNCIGIPKGQQGKGTLLAMVLRNLLENAINYTPEKSLIQLTLSPKSFIIEDNGQGVSDEHLAKLGQPFYRPADRPVQSEQDKKGSGLGISIIQRILTLHGLRFVLSRSTLGGLKAEIFFD